MSKFDIFLSPPHMGGYEQKYIEDAFASNWIAPLGPNVYAFEKEVCEYVNIPNAVALSSGTSAIHLALRYLGVSKGDIVFCSSLTFSASCNPVIYQGAAPVFIDSEPDTWNMSPIALEKAFKWAKSIDKLPKAVIIVDLYGQSADWDKLLPICNKYGVPVVEDAAEALGATYNGRKCGTFADLGVLSFNGNKIITTSGGGMLLCHSKDIKEKVTFWATQSRENELHYEHKELGFNYRLSNICAGVGRGQLKIIDKKIKLRKNIFSKYKKGFKSLPLNMMPISNNGEPNFWLSVALINSSSNIKPSDIVLHMNKLKIETRPAWKPMHLQPFYKDCKSFPHYEDFYVSEQVFDKGICLPTPDLLTEQQQDSIIKGIKNIFG